MPTAAVRVDAVTLESRAATLAKRSLKAESKAAAIELAIACLDLRTLEGKDTPGHVRAVCARGVAPAPGVPHVAAVGISPALLPVARAALAGTGVLVASVATAFSSGLLPLDVKLRETRAAVAAGADEIDVAIDRSAFLAGRYDDVRDEVAAVRDACRNATLNVSLEAGELGSYGAIRRACDLALEGGADFVKAAAGNGLSSTPPIALLMCEALRAHARRTGRAVGFKVACGIRTTKAALGYLAIVNETLGAEWLRPERFRIEASMLLDDLLMQRAKVASGNYSGASYVASA